MNDDVVIRVEGLGKKYVIGHQTDRERYVALRDVVARTAKGLARSAADIVHGRPVVAGDDFEEFWALKDVNFEIKRGEAIGIIGRNGAGKSTLLKILSRITEPSEGRATIKGRVASLLEVGTGFHPELTGRENIYLNGAILGMSRAEIRRKFDEIVAFAEVERFLDTPVKRYSSGMYVRLAFAVAAHLEPETLIVDEVLAVGDAEFQKKCLGKMQDVAVHGRTVLFVSHQLAAVTKLCNSGMLLERGHLKLRGSPSEVIAAYINGLGASEEPRLLEETERRGNGWLRFSTMQLLDAAGSRLSALSSGSSGSIKFLVKNHLRESLHKLHLSIGVHNAMGQRITTWSTTYAGGDFPAVPPHDFTISVRLPRLALLPGKYILYLYAASNEEVVDWLLPGGTLIVEAGDFFGSGQIPDTRDGVFMSEHSFEIACLEGG